jgi:hypothetical protein
MAHSVSCRALAIAIEGLPGKAQAFWESLFSVVMLQTPAQCLASANDSVIRVPKPRLPPVTQTNHPARYNDRRSLSPEPSARGVEDGPHMRRIQSCRDINRG